MAKCKAANIPFRQAVDTPLANGETPLKILALSYDHAALHFVHSQLPAGAYSQGIFLGAVGNSRPAPFVYDWPGHESRRAIICPAGAPFTYRGDLPKGEIHDYGVLTWADGVSYVGQWQTKSIYNSGQEICQTTLLTQQGEDVHIIYTGPWSGHFAILEETHPATTAQG